jgi:hypothetical protein
MTPTTEFDLVNQIYGWGDPGSAERPGIWFFGIEEAGCWPEGIAGRTTNEPTEMEIEQLVKKASEEIRQTHDGLQGPFVRVDQPLTDKDKKSRVYQYSSKIACTLRLPTARTHWKDIWRTYENDLLYREGSSICNVNLFPLGKADTNYWPAHYTRLFGLSMGEYKEYLDKGCGGRFDAMHMLWEKSQPIVTICYWGKRFREFAKLLGWKETGWNLINTVPDILCNKEIRAIVTPHFSRRMSNKKVEMVLEQLDAFL